jgi:hypothetical protein
VLGDGLKDRGGAVGNGFGWCECGEFNQFWEPGDSVGDSLAPCFPHPGSITAVVVKGRSKVPGIFSMGCPGCSKVRFLMNQEVGARWGNRMGLVGIISKHLSVSREGRINTGATQEVQGDKCLGEKLVP